MIRVLLDTDVVLDLLANRQPFAVEASVLWLAHEQSRLEAFVSPITPINVFYILRKQEGNVLARQAVGRLLARVQICLLNRAILDTANALPMIDFEDAVQAASAAAAGLDAIVTRNTKDYTGAPLPILTPTEALARLNLPKPPTAS